MKDWGLSDGDYVSIMNSVEPFEQARICIVTAKVAQKKLIEAIKEDTEDNMFAISDGLWEELKGVE